MYKIFIDTETTGLPKKTNTDYYSYENIDNYNNARMIEIGYMIYDNSDNLIREYSQLIKPDGFIINNTKIHGIEHNTALNEGKNINEVLDILEDDLSNVNYIIAHNLVFDINIILSEAYRLNKFNLINKLKKLNQECTLTLSLKMFKKRYRLVNLYPFLFNKEIIQEHRALSDVKILVECYNEMTKNNLNF
jgi:DNA polymerase-3 subunit alpha